MKHMWIVVLAALLAVPGSVAAESMPFLQVTVTGIEKSIVCPTDETCRSVFFITGRNFLNSNGELGVRVGEEWADIVRVTNGFIMATASEDAYDKMPSVAVDATFTRPRLITSDDVLEQMFEESLDVALASIGVTEDGRRYVTAGPKYQDPARIYYRDTYWTSGLILMIEPYIIRDQILLLASGIEANGRAPSAMPVDPDGVRIPLWVDHQDSGPYFVLLVHDYIRWTGDDSILTEVVNGRSIFTTMQDALSWISTKDTDGNLLPEKPEGSLQDWLDSIPRSGEVFSNQVLYYRALRDLVDFSQMMGKPSHAQAFHRQSMLVRYQINKQFWNEEGGYFYERCEKGVCEERITNESAVAALFDFATETQRERLFEALLQLETRTNPDIAYGDWGVVNAWPFYPGFAEYVYHNVADWPFLDGINAGARLKHGNADWYYPLTRWWTYNREVNDGRILPEHLSPLDDSGGDLQAWSVHPIAAFIRYGLGLDPALDGTITMKPSPVGDLRLEGIIVHGSRTAIDVRGE